MKTYAFINGENVLNIVHAEVQPEPTDLGIFVEYNENTNHAVIGGRYVVEENKFIDPQPYPSWTLNNNTYKWEAPSVKPEEGYYRWDEPQLSWIEMIPQ